VVAGDAAADPPAAGAPGGEKASEMSIPTLIGHDGRRAVPAFTSLDTLRQWRQEARPVPTGAADVWAAAVADDCAVVVDVAGPVPLAIDGARLAALADGRPVPPPREDPDVLAVVRAAAAGQTGITGLRLRDGADGSDLMVVLSVTPGLPAGAVAQLAGVVAEQVMERLGGRLRRGISVAVDVQAPPAARERPQGQD
jgi:SseB protein N-terminal domain